MANTSYCSVDDVQGHTGRSYNADSQPNITEALEIVDDIAAEIDGVLAGAGYSLPVPSTAPKSRKLLRYYNALGAAYRCWHAGVKGTAVSPAAQSWETDYRAFLQRIIDGNQRLPDYAPTTGRKSVVFEVYK